jgi:RNA ligase (TIGR02306 family)
MSERKLATIRKISEIIKIPNADKICAYRVDGWFVVDSVDKYQVGELVVMCEVDSWIPTELAPFLSKGKEPKEFEGIKGERLRTIRLKKQLSQGLILPFSILPAIVHNNGTNTSEGADVTEILGIQKWEKPINPQLAGMMKGNFPSFIPKTDQERIQNISQQTIDSWIEQGLTWEVTEKLHGSSMTVYFNQGDYGVCSRNVDLKFDMQNSFWKGAVESKVLTNLMQFCMKYGRNLAVQGELIGPGINGNQYGLNSHRFNVFNVFDIDSQLQVSPQECRRLADALVQVHAPVIAEDCVLNHGQTIQALLSVAEGKSSINGSEREGLVFKCNEDPSLSFKVVSNKWLLGGGEDQ